MKVKVKLVRENTEKNVELNDKSSVKDLLRLLGYNVQGVVVLKDGIPIIEDEKIHDGDSFTIFLTASGG
ncbi:MoaD/ThiS family protein [Acidianus brierleyi]|uniref:Thiamine biosynthesis protein ThiS n=1 Tax=Acidianus brierleyi TaxID=41673 RepID=A0A2U9IBP0_9CREN|nr:MoaD/ThiS family protein [Acidianus brierleyi]AWR93413.1 MoaD/ThiS family protein [Acidianus brierleyi]